MRLRTWITKDISHGTRVLARCDLNAAPHDAARLAASLPEFRRLLKTGARVIVATHYGRPQGVDSKYSVAPIARALGKALGMRVVLAADVGGPDSARLAERLGAGEVMMLENLRFAAGEERNDRAFAKRLARLADVYVNNAFAVCHRAHASVAAVARYLPSFAGELLAREVRELGKPLAHPFVLVVGGIKLETKLPLLAKLGCEADTVLVGSGLGSPLEARTSTARRIRSMLGDRLVLPRDYRRDADRHAYDIGSETVAEYVARITSAKSVVWNGPLGVCERASGAHGTAAVAEAIAKVRGRTVVGGGETLACIQGREAAFSWVSTGGGAMLAFLSGESMPGIVPLLEK